MRDPGRRRALPPATVPHDISVERALLSEIILNGSEDLRKAAALIQPVDFFDPGCRAVFEAMLALEAMNAPPGDCVLLRHWMEAHGTLDMIGGPAGLSSLI